MCRVGRRKQVEGTVSGEGAPLATTKGLAPSLGRRVRGPHRLALLTRGSGGGCRSWRPRSPSGCGCGRAACRRPCRGGVGAGQEAISQVISQVKQAWLGRWKAKPTSCGMAHAMLARYHSAGRMKAHSCQSVAAAAQT